MAVSVVSFAEVSNWFATTTPKTVTGVSWSSGDVIVVAGGSENGNNTLATPTNANLSFSLQASITTGGGNESPAWIWSAVAGSAQSSQTISVARSAGSSNFGFGVWVLTGCSGSFANASANQTESGFTFTPTAGSGVIYYCADWNANNTNQTPATGTGTATERVDNTDTSTYANYAADWMGVTASSTTFGPSSYTGLKISQVVLEVLASGGGGGTTVNAPNPTAAASAPTATTKVSPLPSAPTAAASAPAATAALTARPPAPVAAASAPQPTILIAVLPPAPVVAGTAPQPTVSTGSNTNAAAGATTVAGTAPAPTAGVSPAAGGPTAAATAPQPTIAITVRPAAPTSAATAPAPSVLAGRFATPPAPTAAASAPQPTIAITTRPGAATVTVTAPAAGSDQVVPYEIRVLPLYSTRTFGADGYQVGENQTVWLPTRLNLGAPLLVVCHGTAAQASWYNDSHERYRPLEAIANTGIVVIAGDLGEPSNADGWGNDLSVARVWQVADWAADAFGCNVDRIHLRGESAGGATALNAARDRPDQVASVHLAAGVCDIESIYQGGAGNPLLVGLIDLAYTAGGGWPAQRATHDPALNTAELVPMADRIRCYYTSGDTLVPPQATLDFAADVGCQAIPVGEMPHSDEVLTSIWPGDVAAWMWSHT